MCGHYSMRTLLDFSGRMLYYTDVIDFRADVTGYFTVRVLQPVLVCGHYTDRTFYYTDVRL